MIACGRVAASNPGRIEARIPGAVLGQGVRITCPRRTVRGTVSEIRNGLAIVTPHGAIDGVGPGHDVRVDPAATAAPLGVAVLGRALDAAGEPIDERERRRFVSRELRLHAPSPHERRPVCRPFWTRVRAIDGLLTLGLGARAGIFGAPGSGKSRLLSALMAGSQADAVVVALVGERGREAERWLAALPAHATIVCATSDRCAAERVRAANVAMAQASELRARGLDVLLIVDSLARLAAAHRELATAAGESVGRGGYPPRVFAELANFVEVAGNDRNGSITLLATILTDGDDRDPVSEAVRALLDGHIQLSAELAKGGKFPAIDVLASVSRTMGDVVPEQHAHDAATVRAALASLERMKDARALGIISADDRIERAVEEFLYSTERIDPRNTIESLRAVACVCRTT